MSIVEGRGDEVERRSEALLVVARRTLEVLPTFARYIGLDFRLGGLNEPRRSGEQLVESHDLGLRKVPSEQLEGSHLVNVVSATGADQLVEIADYEV